MGVGVKYCRHYGIDLLITGRLAANDDQILAFIKPLVPQLIEESEDRGLVSSDRRHHCEAVNTPGLLP